MSIIKDSVYGFVIGDALGVPVEFQSRESLTRNPVTTMIGYGSYADLPEGVWSDDTALTLATMDSISKCNGYINYKDMADRFCNWVNNAEYTSTNNVFDIGITTKYALMKYWEEKRNPTECGGTSINENGNGSLMRMLPIALYCYYKDLSVDEILEVVKNTSSITHAHEQSIIGCFIYVIYLIELLLGKDKKEAYNAIQEINYSNVFSRESLLPYIRILSRNIALEDINSIESSGYIVHTLEAVFWVLLNENNYNDTVLKAVNLGSDTDTIAAIAGSLAGIIYGYDSINKEWIETLKNKELLDNIINDFELLLNKKED